MEAPRPEMELQDDQAEALEAVKASVLELDLNAQSLTDSDYLRFLRARDFDREKSVKLLVQHLKWRRSIAPSGYIKEEEIAKELERKQIILQGHDKLGCSIIIVLTARHAAFERDFEEIKRLFVYAFDKAAASNLHSQSKFMIIADLKGWGIKNIDIRGYLAVLEILQKTVMVGGESMKTKKLVCSLQSMPDVLQESKTNQNNESRNQFPERLRKLFLLHLPYLFWGAWKLVCPFIDKVTREKIVFVEDKRLKETLLAEVEKDQLPEIYGGVGDVIPIQDYAVPK